MGDEGRDARRRIRRAMLARKAASPKLRGQYRRSVRAQRLRQQALDEATPPQRPVARARVEAANIPPPGGRRIAPWVFLIALLPVLLLGAVGAYALNVVRHAERAVSKIQQQPLPRSAQVAGATIPPRPASTPNALGTAEPLTTREPATIDPSTYIPDLGKKDLFTIMLLGVDTREGDLDSRSDTIILVYTDPSDPNDTIHMLSIPRDLLVTMAGGFGQGKMSDVYSMGQDHHYLETPQHANQGGPALVRDTLEQNFGVHIDFYAQIDFNGFREMIDTIGGVTVDNPYPFKDDNYPTEDYQYTRVFFPAGTMHLYGAEALQFARSRYGDDDYARNARQQQVLLGIRQQAQQLNLLTKATTLIDTLGSTVKTDLPTDQWLPLAKFGLGVQGGAIHQFTLTDLLGVCQNCDGFYSTIDWQRARQRAREFAPRENADFLTTQANGGLNKSAAIVVENGTMTAGIASKWSAALRQQGYTNTAYTDAPAGRKGNIAKTRILYFAPDEEKTAQALARAMGLPTTIVDGASPRPSDPGTESADILVLLGNDARAP
jgi:LCP family protein required for cell wall assembly